MLISYSSVRKRLEVKKKKIRPKLRYECEYNQIFATCSSLKKKKKKRVSGILKREPCQIWISEVETVIATDWTHRVTSKYTYLIRENGINFLNQREESGLRERERERGPKGKATLSVCAYLYTVRSKSFLLEREVWILLLYDLTDEYYFLKFSCFFESPIPNFTQRFKQLIYLSFFLFITPIIIKNLGKRKKFHDQRV